MKGLLATVAAVALLGLAVAAPAQTRMTSPISLALHGGAMVTPRGALLLGADAGLPTASVLPGFQGRLSIDVITKANFGGINTIVPITLDQVLYAPRAGRYTTTYFGGGVGAVLGGKAVFDAKLILGMDLTQKVAAEANLHFTAHDTLLTVFARIKL